MILKKKFEILIFQFFNENQFLVLFKSERPQALSWQIKLKGYYTILQEQDFFFLMKM